MISPDEALKHFEKSQIAILIIIIVAAWSGVRSRRESQFKVREADRTDPIRIKRNNDLANAKMKKPEVKPPPLSLPGIRLQGEAHEILGIKGDASEPEIMKAYKDAIKMYHPDRIQGQATEQMKFYQEAAAKLNQAKDTMLKAIKK